jgi:hypothetical protein
LEEVKRLRTCHDDKEKEALSLRRALERLRLEKDDESAALATDKAYICKLEAKVAAQATSKASYSAGGTLVARCTGFTSAEMSAERCIILACWRIKAAIGRSHSMRYFYW